MYFNASSQNFVKIVKKIMKSLSESQITRKGFELGTSRIQNKVPNPSTQEFDKKRRYS
jgi:hypothetical protein